MASMDTMKAVIIPVAKISASKLVNDRPNLASFTRLAPSITGMAKKKVNSAATVREVPIRIAPMMVAPEREVPGISDRT